MSKWLEIGVTKVNEGISEIFNNWSEYAGITKEDFIKALEWLEADPMVTVKGVERLSREVGCSQKGGLVYGKRTYRENGEFNAIYPVDEKLTRLDFPKVSINKHDRV